MARRHQQGWLKKEKRSQGETWVLFFRTVRKSDGKRVENKVPIGLVKDFPREELCMGGGRKTAPPHQPGGLPRRCNFCGSGTSLRGT
jgi:hypothetical protein